MWEEVARPRPADAGAPSSLEQLDSVQIVYCQTWQYDDAVARLARPARRRPAAPALLGHRRHDDRSSSSNATARARCSRGELDLALITSAEALATQRAYKKRGERYAVLVQARREASVPVGGAARPGRGRARGVPGVAHVRGVRQRPPRARAASASTTTARSIGEMLAPMTDGRGREPARVVPGRARARRRSSTPRPDNRMVGYPYTKYMVSVMDVDMAAALVVATHERADALGVPADRRVYLARLVLRDRSRCSSPSTPTCARSPAMARREREALARRRRRRSTTSRYLDLYSCFASSLHFACDALGHRADRPARPHRHRRAAVPRRSGERLPHALDRGDGRAAPRRPRRARARERRRACT